MKHQTLDQLQAVAEVGERYPDTLSRVERLERWAKCLEANPTKQLFTLHETEHRSTKARDDMRGENTPSQLPFKIPSSVHQEWRTTHMAKRSGSLN